MAAISCFAFRPNTPHERLVKLECGGKLNWQYQCSKTTRPISWLERLTTFSSAAVLPDLTAFLLETALPGATLEMVAVAVFRPPPRLVTPMEPLPTTVLNPN